MYYLMLTGTTSHKQSAQIYISLYLTIFILVTRGQTHNLLALQMDQTQQYNLKMSPSPTNLFLIMLDQL